MFAAQRISKIKEILIEKKQIDVITLSNMLSVSEVTVRRDLEKLESENFLTRTHGGATVNEQYGQNDTQVIIPYDDEYFNEKKIIGQIAACMVNDNDTLILGPGNTCKHIAQNIENRKNIRAITTDILVAIELLNNSSDIKVVLTGGDIDKNTYQLSGKIAENNIRNYFVNLAFVEVDGVSMERGYTVDSIEKASIIHDIMSVAREVIAVFNYSKFDNVSFSPLGPINMFTKVISNEQSPEKYKKFYFENNIKFFTTFDVYRGGK